LLCIGFAIERLTTYGASMRIAYEHLHHGPADNFGPEMPIDKRIDRAAAKNVSLKSFGYRYQNGSG
jgi:hypothetical protein